MRLRATAIGGLLAAALTAGAAGGAGRTLYEAGWLPPGHPDYLAWEACARYLPRWAGPFMRGCVAEIRAAQSGAPAPADAGMARFLICSYGMMPPSRPDLALGEMRSAGVPLLR
ncbi:MAG: hypothetical protein ACK4QW_01985 [Alphaproteobacteria bacterium]